MELAAEATQFLISSLGELEVLSLFKQDFWTLETKSRESALVSKGDKRTFLNQQEHQCI